MSNRESITILESLINELLEIRHGQLPEGQGIEYIGRFMEASHDLYNIQKILGKTKSIDLSLFTQAKLDNLISLCENTQSLYESMRSYKRNSSTSKPEIVSKKMAQIYRDLCQELVPIIVTHSDTLESQEYEETFKSRVLDLEKYLEDITSLKEEASTTITELRRKNERSNSIVEELQKDSALVGITQDSSLFNKQAKSHICSSYNWLIVSFLTAVAVIWFALYSLEHLKPDSGNVAMSIQILATKIMILATLGTLFILSVKNYTAHRHNAVLNRHREMALRTFKKLANAADGIENKEIILTHASSCIFSPQETGYSKNSSAPQQQLNMAALAALLPKMSSRTE